LSFTWALFNKRARRNKVLQVYQEKALKQILDPSENATTLSTPSKIKSGLHLPFGEASAN